MMLRDFINAKALYWKSCVKSLFPILFLLLLQLLILPPWRALASLFWQYVDLTGLYQYSALIHAIVYKNYKSVKISKSSMKTISQSVC